MRQIVTSLKKIHDTGTVHRDIKPSNLVVTKQGRIKFVDFGAATDLRIFVNLNCIFYRKKHQIFLHSQLQLDSPILWQLNIPGIVLLPMAIPTLRSPVALKNFNLEMRTYVYDFNKWRDDLLASSLTSKPLMAIQMNHLSTDSALKHPYFLLGGDQAAAVLSKFSFSTK
ncbi:Serine/Threonine kinase domain protein [Medicago truncatula]|uniref:Serine/Threonine kinase domain protein n=1 Tax=Medicago truncatula TaxID=3880 RepID=A0A072U1G3_MEDTR|nr:Serine/Threonine kinase domain protein [Medicago truncatula]